MVMIEPVANSYGGVLVSGGGLVLLREPTRHNAGYVWTFAKGRPEPGETPRATALREVREETGYAARIIAPIPGTFAGTVGRSAFWLMDATHPPAPFDGETVRIHWATFDEARSLFELTETPVGRARDHAILTATERVLQGLPHDQRPALQPQDAKLRETTRQRGERPQGQRSNELSSYA
jgi:8-oxo-dGTP pyrophosphatase MutT (NUDIX family)